MKSRFIISNHKCMIWNKNLLYQINDVWYHNTKLYLVNNEKNYKIKLNHFFTNGTPYCLSSITFTEVRSKSLLCLYLSYKKRLQPQRHWTLNSLLQIFGFWSWATYSDIQCLPFRHVQSLSHNSLIRDLFDWWKVKLVVLSCKIPAF